MKIMQLTGTKNCKVFVNHVELIASARKKGAHTAHTHSQMVRESTLVQIDAKGKIENHDKYYMKWQQQQQQINLIRMHAQTHTHTETK